MSKDPAKLLSRARELEERGKFRKAVDALRDVCQLMPDDIDSWRELARLAGLAKVARDEAEARVQVAGLLLAAGQVVPAAEETRAALRLDPRARGAQELAAKVRAAEDKLKAEEEAARLRAEARAKTEGEAKDKAEAEAKAKAKVEEKTAAERKKAAEERAQGEGKAEEQASGQGDEDREREKEAVAVEEARPTTQPTTQLATSRAQAVEAEPGGEPEARPETAETASSAMTVKTAGAADAVDSAGSVERVESAEGVEGIDRAESAVAADAPAVAAAPPGRHTAPVPPPLPVGVEAEPVLLGPDLIRRYSTATAEARAAATAEGRAVAERRVSAVSLGGAVLEGASADIDEAGGLLDRDLPSIEILLGDEIAAAGPPPIPAAPLSSPALFSPMLTETSRELLARLIEPADFTFRRPGDIVFRQGEQGNHLYIIEQGEVAVRRESPLPFELARLRAGAFFGEMALLTHRPRNATVVATAPTRLLVLSRDRLRELIVRDPEVLRRLLRFLRMRLVWTLLTTSPLFTGIDERLRRELVLLFRLRLTRPQTELVRAGEPSPGLFVVMSGALTVSVKVAVEEGQLPQPRCLAVLEAGDIFGEMSLLEDTAAMASVTTLGWAWCFLLPRERFAAAVAEHPTLLATLEQLASERQARNLQALGEEAAYALLRVNDLGRG